MSPNLKFLAIHSTAELPIFIAFLYTSFSGVNDFSTYAEVDTNCYAVVATSGLPRSVDLYIYCDIFIYILEIILEIWGRYASLVYIYISKLSNPVFYIP